MANNDAPITLDWIHERAKCSLPVVFKELEQGVRDDVEAIQKLFPEDPARYAITGGRNRFTVSVVRDPMSSLISDQVGFELSKDRITIHGTNDVTFTAELTLNRDGRCKLRVGEDELEQWQVRRRALEKLIFGPNG
jgi:hypothetical protein